MAGVRGPGVMRGTVDLDEVAAIEAARGAAGTARGLKRALDVAGVGSTDIYGAKRSKHMMWYHMAEQRCFKASISDGISMDETWMRND